MGIGIGSDGGWVGWWNSEWVDRLGVVKQLNKIKNKLEK